MYMTRTGASGQGGLLRGFGLFVVAGVLVAGSWWGFGSFKNRLTEPTQGPECCWPDESYVPRNEAMPLVGAPDRNGVPNNRRRVGQHESDKVLATEKACKPGACPSAALKEYKSAFFWYV
jgi:hypothetical protein